MKLILSRCWFLRLPWPLIFSFALPLRGAEVGGLITTDTTWTAAVPVYVVTNTITVSANATLRIEAGTLVRLAGGASLIVQAGGAIDVAGAGAKPVLFRSLNATNNWGQIAAAGTNAWLRMRHADAERGQIAVLDGASGLFESCYIHDFHVADTTTTTDQPILLAERAALLVVRTCHFRHYYETHFRLGLIMIEDSLFEDVTGDAIDLDTAQPGSVIRRSTLRHGAVLNADAVDLGSGSSGVLVEQCLLYDFPLDKGVSIGERSTNITVRGCLIYGMDMGVAIKDSSLAALVNNTIIDCNDGLRFFEKSAGQGAGHATAWNNILWNNRASVTLLNGSTISINHSDVAGAEVYPGPNNLNVAPLFRNEAMRDYRLATNSPALGAGTNRTSLGALFPIGSSLEDTDADGLPNTWEMTYDLDFNEASDAANDMDADGLSNLQEYLAGTNPRSAASGLKVQARPDSSRGIVLEFVAAPNRAYTVEFRDSLTGGAWQKFIEVSPTPSEQTVQVPITPTTSSLFFRIVAWPRF